MAINYNVLPLGKGKTVKQTRAKAKREDAKQLAGFVEAVWQREYERAGFEGTPYGGAWWANCQGCERQVYRRQEPMGDVHHVISRRHKSTRYDVANGQLLCRKCHQLIHGREF